MKRYTKSTSRSITDFQKFLKKFPRDPEKWMSLRAVDGKIISVDTDDTEIQNYVKALGLRSNGD